MLKLSYIVGGVMIFTPALAFAQAAAPAGAATATTETTAQAPGAQLGTDGKVVLAPGIQVLDTQGGVVGTLTKVDKDASGQPTNVVLKTTKSEVLIPASSLARTEKSALIAMTAAQIDAAAAAAAPAGSANTSSQTN